MQILPEELIANCCVCLWMFCPALGIILVRMYPALYLSVHPGGSWFPAMTPIICICDSALSIIAGCLLYVVVITLCMYAGSLGQEGVAAPHLPRMHPHWFLPPTTFSAAEDAVLVATQYNYSLLSPATHHGSP